MTPAQRRKWLAERRTGIGGSDAAAAVGRSRWTTPLMLYLDKLGERESEETPAMHWGTLKEPLIRQEYANQTRRTVEVPRKMVRHPVHRFMLVNLDGVADARRVFEAKTARTDAGWGPAGSDEIPEEYVFQTQHAMAVTGLEVADVAVLIGSSDFRIYEIPADLELQELLIEAEAEFWSMVQRRIPPDPKTIEDVRRRWRLSNGDTVTADEEVAAAASKLAICKAQIKVLAEYADAQEAVIQRYMAESAILTDDAGELLATWKNTANPSPKFDRDSFEADHPELYARYLRDAGPSRRFYLKLKANLPCVPQQIMPAIESSPTVETTTTMTVAESSPPSAPKPSVASRSNKGSRRKSKVA